jgi:hypothetical protein
VPDVPFAERLKVGAMISTTIFLGKLLGLYLVAISLGMIANRRCALDALNEMARSGPWMLFSGMAASAGGLAAHIASPVDAQLLVRAPEGVGALVGSPDTGSPPPTKNPFVSCITDLSPLGL